MRTEELPSLLFPLVNRFFKENGHKGKARGNERVFVLKGSDGQTLAALRATPKQNGFLLRSVQVDRSRYGEGLGSQLVSDTLTMIAPAICWCYPFDHLQHFYESCGFQICSPEQVNDDIKGPFQRYTQQGQKLLLMTSSP